MKAVREKHLSIGEKQNDSRYLIRKHEDQKWHNFSSAELSIQNPTPRKNTVLWQKDKVSIKNLSPADLLLKDD